ncbi:MAG: phosphatase PAP2 family protein [Gemmatimonadaceae bacterium]
MACRLLTCWWLLFTAAAAAPLPAQQDSTRRVPLFTRDDAVLGAAFVVGTLAMTPLDRKLTSALQDSAAQANWIFRDAAAVVRTIAVPGAPIIGVSLYAVGRLAHWDRVADLGLHGTEAILVGNVVNTAIKWTVGRARPYAVADSNPNDYRLFRGFREGRDYSSFPSGHALAAFAAAAAVTSESSRWRPGAQWYVGPVMYGGAAAVALSRLYNNQHWASDVVMGAGIGTFAGLKVVRYHHRTNPGNRLDRWLLSASISPAPGQGLVVSWSVAPPLGF